MPCIGSRIAHLFTSFGLVLSLFRTLGSRTNQIKNLYFLTGADMRTSHVVVFILTIEFLVPGEYRLEATAADFKSKR